MGKKDCVICGKAGYMYYPFCEEHLKLKNSGKIVKCETCGTWHFADQPCKCKLEENEITTPKCLLCDTDTVGGWHFLCKDCYEVAKNHLSDINKNYTVIEYKDYYYNAKTNIFRLTGYEKYIKPNCSKLVAIALACDKYADNHSLLDVVERDIREIVFKKKDKDIIDVKKEKQVVEFNTKKNFGTIRGVDGHFLQSNKEKEIDDLLYSNNVLHALHYPVDEITERAVVCDWYIPITFTKGIYIEYFGMDTNDYIQNKNEKIELYYKHNLKLIRIEKDDTMDTQRLKSHILQEIRKYRNEIMNEI